MKEYLQYIIYDIKAGFVFKFIYLIEKIIKYPIILINRKLNIRLGIPFLFKNDYIINNSDGRWLIQGKSGNDYIISLPNEYSLRESFLGIQDGIFLDIGSHIGKWAITICNKRKDVHTYCFEPNPTTYKYLIESIQLNSLEQKIHCYNVGVGDRLGELNFEINSQSAMSKFIEGVGSNFENLIPVKIIKIDDFIQDKKIDMKRIKLIKIDTEGFEFKVLEGMKDLLYHASEELKIICEILPNQKDKDDIIKFLESFGFCFRIIGKQDFFFYKSR